MADKKISQLPNLSSLNYTSSDVLLINNGLSPYSAQTTSSTSVLNFIKYYTGTTNTLTGITFNGATLTLNLNCSQTSIPVTGFTAINLTGGTYSKVLSAMTFTNNSGVTFNVTGMYFPKTPSGTLNSIQYNNNKKFSGNTLIYNSGTTSIYNRGHNGITGNTFYGEDAGGKTSKSGQTIFGAFSYSGLSSTGNYNELFGSYTLTASTSANYNSFFGYNKGRISKTINNSVGFGSNQNDQLSTETQSVFFGHSNVSFTGGTPSSNCVAIGAYSQESKPTNLGQTTSIGFSSHRTPSSQGGAVAIGSYALYNGSNISGPDYSTIIGCYNSQYSTYVSGNNTVIGSNSLKNSTVSKQGFVVIGNDTFVNRTSGTGLSYVTHIGDGKNSYYNQNSYSSYIAIGVKLYPSGSTGPGTFNSHTIGYNIGSSLRGSSFIGNNSFCLYKNSNNTRCLIFGNNISPINANTINSSDGSYTLSVLGNNIFTNYTFGEIVTGNMIMGNYISHTPTSASPIRNHIIGYMAGYNNYGNYNMIIGNKNSYSLSGGTLNTSVGNESLYNSSNSNTTSIGYRSGYSLTGTTNTQNTFIGPYAGSNLKGGSNNTIIGYSGQASSTIVSNEITLGNSSITSLRCNVTSITSLSDLRDKKDIKSVDFGVNIINELNPVIFSWNTRDKSKVGIKSSGFIAQQVLEIENKYNLTSSFKLVYESNPEKLELSSWNILPIMVKSLQDLSSKNKQLKERIKKLII
jgi:hypothetical protein